MFFQCHAIFLVTSYRYSHPIVSIVLWIWKVFQIRKPQPKYSAVCDVSVIQKDLSELYPYELSSSKNLTLKMLMSLWLVSSHGGQTMHKLDSRKKAGDHMQPTSRSVHPICNGFWFCAQVFSLADAASMRKCRDISCDPSRSAVMW